MKFDAGVKYSFTPETGHRASLHLKAVAGGFEFVVPSGSGAYNHLITEHLKDSQIGAIQDKAFSLFGSLQPICTIELDGDDLNHLTLFRVN